MDKGNGRRMDRNNVKTVYPVMEVVSVALNVDAEDIRSYTYRKSNGQRTVN